MALMRRTSLISILILFTIKLALAAESAWNGHTTPDSIRPAQFTPYYVAPGGWHESFNPQYSFSSKHATVQPGAAASFHFYGRRLECYGSRDNRHGLATVYINGSLVDSINNWDPSPIERAGQCILVVDGLRAGRHHVKIVNQSTKQKPMLLDLDACVVTPLHTPSSSGLDFIAFDYQTEGRMDSHAEGFNGRGSDAVEHNPLTIDGHPAWAAQYNLRTHEVFPLRLRSNSFCAGSSYLGNGTLINVGGNPVVEDHTSAADFGDINGLQAIRILNCDSKDSQCEFYENHDRVRMASPRWYNTVVRISDGSAMIIGGSKRGGWINNATVNNPTIEYFPPKAIHGSNGSPIHMPFLHETIGSNLFPHAFSLPDGRVFVAANQDAMIYDWRVHTELRLPRLPNGVRVSYPMAGTAVLLPLSPANGYTPEVLICGGSAIDDKRASFDISAQEPASTQCAQARLMPDAVLLPTGEVLIVNGAGSGISGYGNVRDQVGTSNAANPNLSPKAVSPVSITASRLLTPRGDIMIAGSNPNLDRSEVADPPINLKVNQFLRYAQPVRVSLGDCKADAKVEVSRKGDQLEIMAPPDNGVYPPGPGFIHVMCDDVPSEGYRVMLGDGREPPVDEAAIAGALKSKV
ncbi:hypothetical protein VNI00_003089 [Paramarasmius palmivorus]|uniref:Copper radical oxidase n=1 Tax=Paramarasmius palmivorus TaxID=297713 RepID=A0AAW0DQ22_9AGAR